MNGLIHHPLRKTLAAGAALSGLALAAGCSVAPAGATVDSAAIGPVRTGAGAKNFAPFPVPASWSGQENVTYAMVVKAKTGTAPREFGFTAKSSMVFWLNCIGTGSVHLTSPAIGLKWGLKCGNGADPAGLTVRPPRAAQGKKVIALVTVSAGSRWEVRIDEARA
jgi:hypothetical protein